MRPKITAPVPVETSGRCRPCGIKPMLILWKQYANTFGRPPGFRIRSMHFGILEFLTLAGSLGLFIYGMKVMSEGLQKVAGGLEDH